MQSRHKKKSAEVSNAVTSAAYILGVFFRKLATPPRLLSFLSREKSHPEREESEESELEQRPGKPSRGFKRGPKASRGLRARRREHGYDEYPASIHGTSELARALTDADPLVRAMALETVGDFADDRAGRLLAPALHDADPRVRCAAASAAARSGASGAVFSLILALDDDSRDVRLASARAIQKITGKQIDGESFDDPEDRSEAIDKLKSWWKQRRFDELATGGES